MSRLDDIRALFGELGVDMTDSSHLRQYIPFLLEEERLRLGKVLKDEYYSIAFDGTPIWHQVRATVSSCCLSVFDSPLKNVMLCL